MQKEEDMKGKERDVWRKAVWKFIWVVVIQIVMGVKVGEGT